MRNIFDSTRDQHQHFRGGRISVLETNLMPDDGHAGATAVVDVTIQQSAFKVLNAADVVIESTPQTDTDVFRTWVRWAGSSWAVVDWKRAVVK